MMLLLGSYYPTSGGGGGEDNDAATAGSLYPDDGTCSSFSSSSNNNSMNVVIADIVNNNNNFGSSSSSCAYIENQTLYVMAPPSITSSNSNSNNNNNNNTTNDDGVVVEKKLSGGNSAFDGTNAIVVSYNSDGTAGAVWMLGYTANTSTNNSTDNQQQQQQQQQQGMWEQTGILQTPYEDQLGWSVSIHGSTIVVGAPGYNGKEVPLLISNGWYWSGRGNAIVMTKNEDNDNNDNNDSSSSSNSSGDVWVRQENELVPGEAEDTAGFGNSVDIAGRFVVSHTMDRLSILIFTNTHFPYHLSSYYAPSFCIEECECLIAVG